MRHYKEINVPMDEGITPLHGMEHSLEKHLRGKKGDALMQASHSMHHGKRHHGRN